MEDDSTERLIADALVEKGDELRERDNREIANHLAEVLMGKG